MDKPKDFVDGQDGEGGQDRSRDRLRRGRRHGHFMLNDATWEGATAPATVGLSGGTLKPHVGHKVEVTGTMKAPAKDAMNKDATMAAPDMKAQDMKKEATMAGTLAVRSSS